MHVAPHFLKARFILDDHRAKAPLKQMATAPVAPVEPDALTDVQPLDRPAQVGLGRFQQQMIMVGHEHIGVDANPKPFRQGGQQLDEPMAVTVVAKNVSPLVVAGGVMVAPAGQLNA